MLLRWFFLCFPSWLKKIFIVALKFWFIVKNYIYIYIYIWPRANIPFWIPSLRQGGKRVCARVCAVYIYIYICGFAKGGALALCASILWAWAGRAPKSKIRQRVVKETPRARNAQNGPRCASLPFQEGVRQGMRRIYIYIYMLFPSFFQGGAPGCAPCIYIYIY